MSRWQIYSEKDEKLAYQADEILGYGVADINHYSEMVNSQNYFE
ncbi:hypothetical protein B6N60_03012 [Richelia sinica FACHB-800]|uniref:Uncharacterized protein n=1 Tax=Richelia sinica FACHB-800 TaxID=1357546 RepID=A0A975T8V7_9NOST|nr:hypothetical protein B6N60_03012 [Richelia sinica FACHB-800]